MRFSLGLTIPLGVCGLLIGGAMFEQVRYLLTRPLRQKSLRSLWGQEAIPDRHPVLMACLNAMDYLFYPIFMTLGWSHMEEHHLEGRQYHSLSIAGRFVNPFVEWQDRNITNLFHYLQYRLFRHNRNNVPKDDTVLQEMMPIVKPNFELLNDYTNSSNDGTLDTLYQQVVQGHKDAHSFMTCTWIGQSTCFVQMDGFNILTDPIFSKTTIGDWLGVKRIRPVPCQLKELPKVDIVIVSHNHYDHLDVNVIQELGNDVTWYVPLGMASYLYRYNVTRVVELDWWQETRHVSEKGSLDIIATPIQHWSGRHFFDINATLWCSFLVRGHLNSFFHCGDTGYCSVFKEIGQLYGPVSFAALPIGSYEPRHYLCHQHMDPHEACMVHQDIQAKCSIGVHWGTFMMSDEFYLDPPREFEEARKDLELPKGSIVTKHLGETFVLPCFPLNADSWIHLED